MPSNWANNAAGSKPQQTGDPVSQDGPPDAPAGRRRLSWGVAAVGLGLVAQLALTGGQPLLGILGLATAAVIFVTNMRPYLLEVPASRWDRRPAPPEASEMEQEAEHPQLPAGTTDLRGRLAYVQHNWRELTIAEIVSGSMPSLPRDAVSEPTTPPPPAADPVEGDPASRDLGDGPEDAPAGEE